MPLRPVLHFEVFLESGGSAGLTAPEDRVGVIHELALPATDSPRAPRVRRMATRALTALLEPFDAVIAPPYRHVASLLSGRILEEPNDLGFRTIGAAANLCGLSGFTLASGDGREGLATAVNLTGQMDADAALVAADNAFQHLAAWHRGRPSEVSSRSDAEHTPSA